MKLTTKAGIVVKPCRLALLAALPLEVRPFLRQVKARRLHLPGLTAWELPVGEGRGVVALTGMGEPAARRAVACLLSHWRPETLVSVGFGGGLRPGLAPGDVVLGESFWHFYPETGELREIPSPPSPRSPTELAARLRQAGLPVSLGNFISAAYILHKESQGDPLRGVANPVLDLETSAAAAAAAAHGLNFVGLRVITDAAGEEIPDFIREWAAQGAAPGLRQALAWAGASPRRWGELLRLWRHSRTAARRLALALEALVALLK